LIYNDNSTYVPYLAFHNLLIRPRLP